MKEHVNPLNMHTSGPLCGGPADVEGPMTSARSSLPLSLGASLAT